MLSCWPPEQFEIGKLKVLVSQRYLRGQLFYTLIYRGTSLTTKGLLLGRYSTPLPRALW